MASSNKIIAIVTGANQGLGRGLVWNLLLRLSTTTTRSTTNTTRNNAVVYLGARNKEKGYQAIHELNQEYNKWHQQQQQQQQEVVEKPELKFLLIDVASDESVKAAAAYVVQQEQLKLADEDVNPNDSGNTSMIFIHNAAARMTPKKKQEEVADVINTNNKGTHRVIHEFGPLLLRTTKHSTTDSCYSAFLVVASSFGSLRRIPDSNNYNNSKLVKTIQAANTLEKLDALLDEYVVQVQAGEDETAGGWPSWLNISSKILQVAAMRIFAQQWKQAAPEHQQVGSTNDENTPPFFVAAVCPGLVQTEASRPHFDPASFQQAPTPIEAAKPIVDMILTDDGNKNKEKLYYGELVQAQKGIVIPWI